VAATVAIVLFEDFEALDVIGPLALLRAIPDQLRTFTVALDRTPVKTAGGMTMLPDATLDEVPEPDVLLVPGGNGIINALTSEPTLEWLASAGARARYVTSVCTGSLVLGAAGLLRGYRATTHWRSLDLLPLVGAEPVRERIVRDRNRITGGGVTAGLDFGLALIEELCGIEAAQTAQLAMEYDPQPPLNAGTPESAPPAVVRALVERTAHRQAERRELLARPFSKA
jgi:cyclohexyl-isocyanide hydratase